MAGEYVRPMTQEQMEGLTSTCGSNEYYPASFGTDWEYRNEASRARLMDLGYESEASRENWSQMESDTDLETEIDIPMPELAAENVKVFRSLQEQWPGGFFRDGGDEWVLGRKIAEGGWAEVFEAQVIRPDGKKRSTPWVLKVLKESVSLRDLQTLLPLGMLQNDQIKRNGRYWNGYSCSIHGGILLKNGRFAFQMTKYWGDLRQLIDIKLQHNPNRGSPFTDDKTVTKCVLDIAKGMLALHNDNIIHRDLNASSVQIRPQGNDFDTIHGRVDCKVTGFESSVGVVGKGFWTAPEILLGVKNQDIKPELFSQKSDVYSYAMTCYEILTGGIPLKHDFDAVLQGRWPSLPSNTKPWMEALLKRCWHREPSERPTFQEIVDIIEGNCYAANKCYTYSQQASTRGESGSNYPVRIADFGAARHVPLEFVPLGTRHTATRMTPTFGTSSELRVDYIEEADVRSWRAAMVSQQASTWGELNDPRRVVTGSDETGHGKRETGHGKRETGHGKRETGLAKRETGHGKRETGLGKRETGHVKREPGHVKRKPDLPILIQMLEVTLQRCGEKAQELSQHKDKVEVFRFQCVHLVDTISAGIGGLFRQFPQLLEPMKEPVTMGDIELRHWLKCVTFGIHSVVDLTHKLQSVVEILSVCSANEWWRTALRLSSTPPHPELPRWSMFGLALRQCEWSMDIVQYAIMKMRDDSIVESESDVVDSRFEWCEERQRSVLQLDGLGQYPPSSESEGLAASLRVALALEAKDRDALVEKLENLKTKRLADRRWFQKIWPSLQPTGVDIASFLMLKLQGPVPQASYLPYSIKIDHASNLALRRELARGAPGTSVFEYKWCDQIVVVKQVYCKGSRRRFEEEAAALAAVQHPNVVQLMGCAFREKDEMLMLVMEYMEEDLRVIIDRRCPNPGLPGSSPPFPLIVAIDMMLQIAEGMRFLREHKIMHGDLKAKNVLVNTAYRSLDCPIFNGGEVPRRLSYLLNPESYYVVKLADFGEARHMPVDSTHTVTRRSGTLRWMAPEMVYIRDAEVPSEYSWRADVYSYALTCYEILTGHIPFKEVPSAALRESRDRPGLELGEGLPATLVSLMERCLDKLPDKRPTFSEICKELWQCRVDTITSIFRASS